MRPIPVKFGTYFPGYICHNMILTFHTSPQQCLYTTLWNEAFMVCNVTSWVHFYTFEVLYASWQCCGLKINSNINIYNINISKMQKSNFLDFLSHALLLKPENNILCLNVSQK